MPKKFDSEKQNRGGNQGESEEWFDFEGLEDVELESTADIKQSLIP